MARHKAATGLTHIRIPKANWRI